MDKKNEKGKQPVEIAEEKDSAIEKPFKVSDRRFWKKREDGEPIEETTEPEFPTYIEELKSKKEESEQKLREYIEAFKKMQTEQEEFRERLKRDIDKRITAGKKDLFIKLLDMMDNLDRAIASAQGGGDSSALLDGIIITRDLFLSILKQEGVERMEVMDTSFDPKFAEAVLVQDVDDPKKTNLIVEEIQPGYTFNGETLRPAKVKVAKFSEREPEKES